VVENVKTKGEADAQLQERQVNNMTKNKIENGNMVEDNGWCEFKATEEYRENYDRIFKKKLKHPIRGKHGTYDNSPHTEPVMGIVPDWMQHG